MPVITFRRSDLESLLGRYFSSGEELVSYLNRLKGEVEGVRGDEVEFEVTHDRPDLFSVEGIARALKGLMGIEVGLPRVNVVNRGFVLNVDNVPNRPFIAMGIVRDVRLSDEAIRQMIQLQEKLHMTYGRNRRKMAIGFYDLDKIKPPITYRLMPMKEVRYRPLGYQSPMSGEEVVKNTDKGIAYGQYAVYGDKVPVLQDSENNILVIIPVLGSEDFKVTESTKNVLIDVTALDLKLAKTTLAILTYNLLERSSTKTVELINIRAPWGSMESPDLRPMVFNVGVDFINDYLGLELTKDDIVRYLLMSRHDVEDLGSELRVSVAPYRVNVLHAVDLAEDVAVAYGYDRIPRELPRQSVKGSLTPLSRYADLIRDIMIGMGFQEVLNYMMSSRDTMVNRVRYERPMVEVQNPKSELYTVIRDHIWPQLLEVASRNKAMVEGGLRVFEVGFVARSNGVGEVGVEEHLVLGMLIIGPGVTLTNGLSAVTTLMSNLGLTPKLRECAVPGGLSERTACITLGDGDVGFVMEVSPDVLLNFELTYPAVVAEVSIDELLRRLGK
ncbi:phenylalanine--tRNA ligase subunit beta [Vulcanisaeta thermophila]|uniref:phenylalanine--tRNA ligase subunit beta n=1 Tax=Vulcanisaeta thermophila TaxID=867917 RepID=UPI0008537F29|nr:phenylalanine--tRNA ligase subunit beta [Vulcanisaeta thermophila]